jgi:hypothetical protein
MATVGKKGDGRREGAVKGRKQVLNPKTKRYVKIDRTTGRFMDVKADAKPFKGVTKKKTATAAKKPARKTAKKK